MPDWEKIVKETGPRLLRYFGASFPRHVASDLVQETFIRLIQRCEAGVFDPKRGNYGGFAFGIAHYVRLEYLKSKTHKIQLTDALDQSPTALSFEETYFEKEESLKLRQAISKLNEIERSVILLLIDQDLSLKEIGIILGSPEGTIKSHIFRAKANLKSMLEGEKYERTR